MSVRASWEERGVGDFSGHSLQDWQPQSQIDSPCFKILRLHKFYFYKKKKKCQKICKRYKTFLKSFCSYFTFVRHREIWRIKILNICYLTDPFPPSGSPTSHIGVDSPSQRCDGRVNGACALLSQLVGR